MLNRFLFMSKSKKTRKKSQNRPGKSPPRTPHDSDNSKNISSPFKKARYTANKKRPAKTGSMMTRRNAIRMLIALPVAGTAGAVIHRYDVNNRGLHDLSLIGQGTPVVVQIHDPACNLCRRLMNNTRSALKDRDNVVFRVADITSGDGARFQKKHAANTVSLLLFNSKGRHVDTVTGVASVDELSSRFGKLN